MLELQQKKNKAVAELMAYVGRSVKMEYDRALNGGSGSNKL